MASRQKKIILTKSSGRKTISFGRPTASAGKGRSGGSTSSFSLSVSSSSLAPKSNAAAPSSAARPTHSINLSSAGRPNATPSDNGPSLAALTLRLLAGAKTSISLQEMHGQANDASQSDPSALYALLLRSFASAAADVRSSMQTGQARVLADTDGGPPHARHAALLSTLLSCWHEFCRRVSLVRSVFILLDRTYALQTPGVLPLYEAGLQAWKDAIFGSTSVELAAHDGQLATLIRWWTGLVTADRDGVPVDRALLADTARLLQALSLYTSHAEPAFVDASREFYVDEGKRLVTTLTPAEVAVAVERRLENELDRCDRVVAASTAARVMALLDAHLIADHVRVLADERTFDKLAQDHDVPALGRVYALLSRVGALASLETVFTLWVRTTATALVVAGKAAAGTGSRRPPPAATDGSTSIGNANESLVGSLLRHKRQTDELLAQSFRGDEHFAHGLKTAYEVAVNTEAAVVAKALAKHVDGLLRGGSGSGPGVKLAPAEIDEALDQSIVLFRFLSGKDVFEAFFKRDLARRLLLARSASADAETAMLGRLRRECGNQFTSKLEGMFRDMSLSEELATRWRDDCPEPSSLLKVTVLTQGFWPAYQQASVVLPPAFASAQEAFEKFYATRHSGRRLTWISSLGSVVLKARLGGATKELTVSLHQALVLLALDEAGSSPLTFDELVRRTGAEPDYLQTVVASLACVKPSMRLLVKTPLPTPTNRAVAGTDTLVVNDRFTSKLARMRFNTTIQAKDTPEEEKKTTAGIFADRKHQVDAAIVRIMKARQTLPLQLLVAETIGQLKFPASVADIRGRIDTLMDREYLEADEEDADTIRYLA